MGSTLKKRLVKGMLQRETPVERAIREYYENASEEAIAEENALGMAFAQTASEINFDEQY